MAGIKFKVSSGELTSNSSSNPRTILQLYTSVTSMSKSSVLINEISVSFKGTNISATPAKIEVYRQSNEPPSPSSLSPVTDPDDSNTSLEITAQYAQSYSMGTEEPSYGNKLMAVYCHPSRGWTWKAAPGREIKMDGGSYLGLVVSTATSVTVVGRMVGEQ